MYSNTVKRALKAGQLQLGMNFGQLRSPEIPRLLVAAGFHWAFIDTEHGRFDLETVQDICRVAQLAGLCPVVRVVDLQYGLVARALDCGYGLQPSQTAYSTLSFSEIIEHLNANTLTVLQS